MSDKERKIDFDNLFKDVASVLAEKCVNPNTNRPYTITMLERALKDIHFNCDTKKSAKQQALEALPLLQVCSSACVCARSCTVCCVCELVHKENPGHPHCLCTRCYIIYALWLACTLTLSMRPCFIKGIPSCWQ